MELSIRLMILAGVAGLLACTHSIETGQPTVLSAGKSTDASRDPSDVESMVKDKLPDLDSCYKEERQRNPLAFGKALFSFDVQRNGRTSDVRLLASTLKSPVMEGCLVGRIEAWQFQPPPEVLKVRYPFSFQP